MTPAPRPRIAFFDYPDVFEDFYAHYGVSQREFATQWSNTGAHDFLRILQESIGDVTWYEFSLDPQLHEAVHEVTKSRVRFVRSPLLHRLLWAAYYQSSISWRFPRLFRAYSEVSTFLVNLSPAFIRALKKDRPSAFFVQDYASGRFDLAVLLSRWLKIPAIGWHAGSRPQGYLGMWARGFTLRRVAAVIASSTQEADMLVTRFGVSRSRISVILTPIDLAAYRPLDAAACRSQLRLPSGVKILLFVGRFDDAVKRITNLLSVVAELVQTGHDIHLVLLGGGDDEAAVRGCAQEKLAARAHFAGWVKDAQTKSLFYNAADILMLPSMREGFPTVIGEALACGTPAVASAVGGIPEVITDGITGVLVPPGDDAGLRAGITRMLEHPGLRTSIREQCRRVAERRLSVAVVAKQLGDCLDKAGMKAS